MSKMEIKISQGDIWTIIFQTFSIPSTPAKYIFCEDGN